MLWGRKGDSGPHAAVTAEWRPPAPLLAGLRGGHSPYQKQVRGNVPGRVCTEQQGLTHISEGTLLPLWGSGADQRR